MALELVGCRDSDSWPHVLPNGRQERLKLTSPIVNCFYHALLHHVNPEFSSARSTDFSAIAAKNLT